MTEENKETVKPAAEAVPTEEKPDPKKEAAEKLLNKVRGLVVAKFGESVLDDALLMKHQPTIIVKRDQWLKVIEFLHTNDELLFDYLEVMAGTDYPANGYIEVVVYLYSMKHGHFITMKTRTPRENAELQSLTSVFKVANWEEREIFDLVGVKFTGHPDMRRIMMPEDYEGHPLRKDFSVWKE